MSTYKMKPNLLYSIRDNTLYVHVPNQGLIKIQNLSEADLYTFHNLINVGIDTKDIIGKSIIYKLRKLNVLYQVQNFGASPSNRTLHWFNYFLLEPESFIESLSKIKIAILGCGGLGSIIFQQLLQTGFKEFFIVDNALVNCEDLNRQAIFRKVDIGHHKVDALAKYACEEYVDVEVNRSKMFIDKMSNGLSQVIEYKPDVIFHCIDTPSKIEDIVVGADFQTDVVIMLGSVGLEHGTVGPLLINYEGRLKFRKALKRKVTYANIIKGSIAMTNNIVASKMTLDVVTYLMGNLPTTLNNQRTIYFKDLCNL